MKLGSNIRETIRNIPNVNLLNVINDLNGNQLEKLEELLEKSEATDDNTTDKNLQWRILEKQAELIQIMKKYATAYKKRLALEHDFPKRYDAFLEQLRETIINHQSNQDAAKQELIEEYVWNRMKQNGFAHCIDYLKRESNSLKMNSEILTDYLSDHEVNSPTSFIQLTIIMNS